MTRTAILSDIHGNLTALQSVLEHVKTQAVDRIVCLGDVVGYGPKPQECLDIVAGFDFCVLGNHDSSALFDPEGFNSAAEQAIFWTRAQLELPDNEEPAPGEVSPSRKRLDFLCNLPRSVREDDVLFVHGSPRGPTNEYVMPEDVQNTKKMEKLFSLVQRLCFQGHTHVPGVFSHQLMFTPPAEIDDEGYDLSEPDARYMINVGSVGQPRDLDPRSCYVVLDENRVYFHRVEYDIEATVSQIEAEAELDNFLGYRLREGR